MRYFPGLGVEMASKGAGAVGVRNVCGGGFSPGRLDVGITLYLHQSN